MNAPMTPDDERIAVAADLRHAEQLTREGTRSARWFVRYLYAYALASFALAVGFGLLGPERASVVLIPVWVVLISTLAVWCARQRTRLRGMNRINTGMIIAWTAAWVVTVAVGTHVAVPWFWWVLGGLAMAVPPVVAARLVGRRTRA